MFLVTFVDLIFLKHFRSTFGALEVHSEHLRGTIERYMGDLVDQYPKYKLGSESVQNFIVQLQEFRKLC